VATAAGGGAGAPIPALEVSVAISLQGNRRLRLGAATIGFAVALAGGAAQAADTQPTSSPGTASPLGNYLAADYALATNDFGAAAAFIADTLASDPENIELLQKAYFLLIGEGRLDEAEDVARRLEKIEGDATSISALMATRALKTGDLAAAERYADAMAPGGANRLVGPMLQAWVKLAGNHYDEALTALAALERVEGFAPVYIMQRGMLHEVAGKLEAAEQDYAKAVEISGEVPLRLVELLGGLYHRTGRLAEARAIYERFLEDNPDSLLVQPLLAALDGGTPPPPALASASDGLAEAMFSLAAMLLREDASDMALVFVRLALDLRPDHPLALVLLGDTLRAQERYEEAIAVYEQLPADTAYGWHARLSVAEALEQLERTEEAEKLLGEMIDQRPDRPDAAVMLGNLLRGEERFDGAAAAYDVAIARSGELRPNHWTLLYFRGIANERSDQWAKAEEDFLRALELEPDQPFVLNYLAYSWVEKGMHFDRSLEMLEKAVAARPNDGYIVDSLGWVFYRLGRYEEAVDELERAVALKPVDPVLNDHLGDAYWRVGRRVEARYQWKRALLFKPEADQITAIQLELQNGLASTESNGSGG
jgi:tetratricopeptide (TPR) repeat protein